MNQFPQEITQLTLEEEENIQPYQMELMQMQSRQSSGKSKEERLVSINTDSQSMTITNLFLQNQKSSDSLIRRVDSALQPQRHNSIQPINDQEIYLQCKFLGKLKKLLTLLFQDKSIPVFLTNLKKEELQILKALIKRKFKYDIQENIHQSFLKEIIKNQMVTNLKRRPRPEEKYKFVFKRCLKKMRNKIKQQNKKSIKKEDIDMQFLEHYFRETSQKMKIDIEKFRAPTNSQANTVFKTINLEYVGMIQNSKIFVEDFNREIDNILEDYEQEVQKKFEDLVKDWNDKLISQEDQLQKQIELICCDIKRNTKFKIPWNIMEVRESIKGVKKLFLNAKQIN